MSVKGSLRRVLMAAPGLVLRSPLHRLMDKSLLLLEFPGRSSGKQYAFPIAYVRDGDDLLVTTQRRWRQNLPDNPQVKVLLQGETIPVVAEVVRDREALRHGFQTILEHAPRYERFLEISLDDDGTLPDAALQRAIDNDWAVVRLTPRKGP